MGLHYLQEVTFALSEPPVAISSHETLPGVIGPLTWSDADQRRLIKDDSLSN